MSPSLELTDLKGLYGHTTTPAFRSARARTGYRNQSDGANFDIDEQGGAGGILGEGAAESDLPGFAESEMSKLLVDHL
jgi:hypothetical protein